MTSAGRSEIGHAGGMRASDWSVLQVERLARAQHGVVSREQAADLGVSPRLVSRLLATGRWRAHFGMLLAPGNTVVTDSTDALALHLRLGTHSLVSGPTALRLQSIEVPDRMLVVWVPRSSMPRVHGVRLLRDDVVRQCQEVRGLRLVAPVDALLDTLITVSEQRSRELLDTALQLRWITVESWSDAVTARLGRGRLGATRLRMLGQRITDGTHSDGERRCAGLFRRAGITGWVPNFVLRDSRGLPIAELDFAFPHLRLCVEIDGREAHSGAIAFERDRRRQNALVLDGWTVLRFTWHQIVHEPEWVIAQVRAAMAACAVRA